jgi:hypothetical protein
MHSFCKEEDALPPPHPGKIKKTQMSMLPVLGKLWISLRPTNSEIRITSGRPEYQQLVIFRLIEKIGFDTVVHIQPPPTGEVGRVPFI